MTESKEKKHPVYIRLGGSTGSRAQTHQKLIVIDYGGVLSGIGHQSGVFGSMKMRISINFRIPNVINSACDIYELEYDL